MEPSPPWLGGWSAAKRRWPRHGCRVPGRARAGPQHRVGPKTLRYGHIRVTECSSRMCHNGRLSDPHKPLRVGPGPAVPAGMPSWGSGATNELAVSAKLDHTLISCFPRPRPPPGGKLEQLAGRSPYTLSRPGAPAEPGLGGWGNAAVSAKRETFTRRRTARTCDARGYSRPGAPGPTDERAMDVG